MYCELINNEPINKEIFRLDFIWPGTAQTEFAAPSAPTVPPALSVPRAGQFFMVKPKRSTVFLARPISIALWESNTVKFLIARRGRGTGELAAMRPGEEAELIGPLGNAWKNFLPKKGDKPIALVGGGIGIAPLEALVGEESEYYFDFYAGFRTGLKKIEENIMLLGPAYASEGELIIATEDGKSGKKGLIPDFLEPAKYAAVCACGPEPMLKAVAEKCKAVQVPCFVSMEKRMACGVGACLGCTVRTVNGNRRCCADGPIFIANEVIFDD